jgi:TonB-linked SusC/RagA family outer membrane protein
MKKCNESKGDIVKFFLPLKLLKVMRNTLIILLITTLQLFAENSYSQNTKLSLNLQDVSIESVLDEIEGQSDFYFVFNYKLVDVKRKVDIEVDNQPITDILASIFSDADVEHLVLDRQIMLSPKKYLTKTRSNLQATPQPRTITGSISDEDGAALPGVYVTIQGTTRGAMSDADGNYSIEVEGPEDVLIFSFVGTETQEITVGAQTAINVSLISEAAQLEDIVVVGYAVQKKVSLTSSVGQVTGENLTKRPVSNLQQAIQGKTPGLTIIDQGGAPGKTNTVMRIRGITTLSNNNPLVIIDGIEQSIDNINPEDIESISVLKDASSTAIYGSRAANGVILVTTKRARSGKVRVSYDGYYGLQKYNNLPPHMGIEDYMRNQNTASVAVNRAEPYSEAYIQEYVNATDRLKYPLPNDWFNAVLKTAPQRKHSLTIEGGDEDKFKVRMNIRNQYQEGVIPNTELKINEVRLNTDYQISSKIKVSGDINYQNFNSTSPPNGGAKVFTYFVQRSNFAVPQYPDGTYGLSPEGNNPLMYSEIEGTDNRVRDYLVGNLKGEWEIIKGLTFSTQLGARVTLTADKNYLNKYEVFDYYDPSVRRKWIPLNSLTEGRTDNREYTINNLLNYSLDIEGHAINVLAGYSQISNMTRTLGAFRQDFFNNDIQSIEQGANDATKSNYGREYEWALRSYFGRLNYSYEEKYLFEANGRYDGSSRFLGDNQFSFFPSFSAGWRLSREEFWGGLNNYVNEFKIRGSWGKTGNQAVDLYTFYPGLDLLTYSLGGNAVQGYTQRDLVNEDLTWETTTQYDIGIDAQFLSNRVSLSVDYYNKVTDGILLVLPVPKTLGLEASAQNAGRVDNKGWEFIASTRNNFGDIGLNASLNFAINNNEVIDLAGSGPYLTGRGMAGETIQIIGEGYPYMSLWGPKTDGFFQTQAEVDSYTNFRANTKPGDVKIIDKNEDGVINVDDCEYMGNTFPKYTFGSLINLNYKGFSLNLTFQGVAGVKTRIGGTITDGGIWSGFTHDLFTGNQWTPDNPDPNARFPLPRKSDNRNSRMMDIWVFNGAYLRLKNAQLMYQIPSSLTQRILIDRMSVYVSGTNLFTISELNEWNIDAESPTARVQNYGAISVYTLGVNINF